MQAFSASEATTSIERWGSDATESDGEGASEPPVRVCAPSAPAATESLSLVTSAAIKSSLLQNVPEALAAASAVTAEVAARELFAHIDRNGDGAISIEELQDVMRDLGEDSAAAAAEARALHAALTDRRGAGGHITYADLLSFHRSALASDSGLDSSQGASRKSSPQSLCAVSAAARQLRHDGHCVGRPFGACMRGVRLGRQVSMRAHARDQQSQSARLSNGAPVDGPGQVQVGVRTVEVGPAGAGPDVLQRPQLRADLSGGGDDGSYRWTDPNATQWDVPLDQLEAERAELEASEGDMPEEQRRFLDRINLDVIPGGLDTGKWQAADVLQVAGTSARVLREASPFMLLLDEGAVDCVDNVLGALVLRDGRTALVVPAHGPLVMGATKFRGCDVVLDEPRISGRHVFFEAVTGKGGTRLTVTDMGSTNGVYFNGEKLQPWAPVELGVGDVVVLGAREFARFEVGPVGKADLKVRGGLSHLALSAQQLLRQPGNMQAWRCFCLSALPCNSFAAVWPLSAGDLRWVELMCCAAQEASTIAALVDDLKALGHHMSDRAWRINKRQRLALGCLRHPASQLTKATLAESGRPPVAKTLPRTSLADVATAAVPLAAWNRRGRDDLVRDLLRQGNVNRAVDLLHRLAVNYPTDPRTWVALAELRLFYDADVAAARVRCRAALEALCISRSQLKSIISLGHDHTDKLIRLDLIQVHVRHPRIEPACCTEQVLGHRRRCHP